MDKVLFNIQRNAKTTQVEELCIVSFVTFKIQIGILCKKNVTEFVEDILEMFMSGTIHISVIFEKLTSINQVMSVLKQIVIYFGISPLNYNHNCYYKINLDVRVLSLLHILSTW